MGPSISRIVWSATLCHGMPQRPPCRSHPSVCLGWDASVGVHLVLLFGGIGSEISTQAKQA